MTQKYYEDRILSQHHKEYTRLKIMYDRAILQKNNDGSHETCTY